MTGNVRTNEQACQPSDFEAELCRLAELRRPALVTRWRRYYRDDPPKGLSRSLMLGAVAYRMQAKRSGGVSLAVRRRLKRMAEVPEGVAPVKASPRGRLAPGTRLVREWNGATHVVEVVEGGVLWNGQHLRSLSAVAQAIAGARWSGPRFFGLTSDGTS